jgi:asparagine synthase (glutamine-hydrolysing)
MCGFLFHNFSELMDDFPNEILRHRGPDNYSVHSHNNFFFHHWRLSILDLSISANQPIISDCNRYRMVYNGEIYNFREIRKELEVNYGHVFKTSSDTEVLFYGLIYEGKRIIAKLNGMFALVFDDSEKGEQIMARDYFGIKPLFYYTSETKLVASSEIAPIHYLVSATRCFRKDVQAEALSCGYISGKNTLYEGIYKLEPGTIMTFKHGTSLITRTERYKPNLEDLKVNDFNSALNQSIKGQVLSDVPIGVLNSGGIDSGLVSYFVGKSLDFGKSVKSFTAIFKENKEIDESSFAKYVATFSGLNHVEVSVEHENLGIELKRLIKYNKEVLVHPNSYNIFLLGKKAKESVKVLLSGEGSDELFEGYNYNRLFFLMKTRLGRKILGITRKNHPYSNISIARNKSEVYSLKYSYLSPDYTNFLISNCSHLSNSLKDRNVQYQKIFSEFGLTKKGFSILELMFYLPPLLDRQDRMLMASSIEGRVPFLDNYILAFLKDINNNRLSSFIHGKIPVRSLFKAIFGTNRKKFAFSTPLKTYISELESVIQCETLIRDYAIEMKIEPDKLLEIYSSSNFQVKWIILNIVILHSETCN